MSWIGHRCNVCGCYIQDERDLCLTCETIIAKENYKKAMEEEK